jgi:large conductance mechanosensitive channel
MPSKKTTVDTKEKSTPTERIEKAEARAERAEAKVMRLRGQAMVSNQVRGFFDFLREQSVIGLAIGLVLGTQAKVLVDQLIASFFNPFIGLLLPGKGTLAQKTATVTLGEKTAVFGWGAFVISLLTFVVVAAVVYYVFKGLRLDKLDKKKDEAK